MSEVVVIGGGNAGLPAAIHAADAGAHVTIIEKTGELGGALWFTSHMISGAGTRMQRDKGIDDKPDLHYQDMWRIGRQKADPKLLRVAVDNAGAGIDWLQEIGVPFTEQSPYITLGHEAYSVPRTYSPVSLDNIPGGGPGRQVLKALEREVQRRRDSGAITIRFRTRATELLKGSDGAISGVRIEHAGASEDLRADAVILATGSYGANFELLRKYYPDHDKMITICPPHATGDGLFLAEGAGGTLTHMDLLVLVVGGVEDRRSPGLCIYWVLAPNTRPPDQSGDIWVNRDGRRFIREDEESAALKEDAVMAQPGTELYMIFDDPMRRGLTDQVAQATRQRLEGHTPNIIFSAPTVEELAIKLDLPPANLRETVDRYNAAVESGQDAEFGRTAMPKKLDTPPYHGIRTAGTLFLTHGGVKVNEQAQVVRPDGTAIPNLFAAGDVMGAGQVMGEAFAGGQGVGVALTFGIIAGRNAATIRPAIPAR